MRQIHIVENQVRSALRNQVTGKTATMLRETSLVRQASQYAGQAMVNMDQKLRLDPANAGQPADHRPKKPASPRMQVQDGYVRRSPVQPVQTAPDYYRNIVKRIVLGVLLGCLLLAGAWALMRSGFLAF